MVFNIMRLPKQFPLFRFEINYPGRPWKPPLEKSSFKL